MKQSKKHQAYKDIKTISASLPKFQRKNPDGSLMYSERVKTVLGKDLPKEYKKKNDWFPMRNYTIRTKEPVLINHEVNMIKLYNEKGMDAVNGYIESINNIVKSVSSQIKNDKELTLIQKIIKWLRRS